MQGQEIKVEVSQVLHERGAGPVVRMSGEVCRVREHVAKLGLAVFAARPRGQTKSPGEQDRLERPLIRAPGIAERARVERLQECLRLASLGERDSLIECLILEIAVQVPNRKGDEAAIRVGAGVFELEARVLGMAIRGGEIGCGLAEFDHDMVGAAPQTGHIPSVVRLAGPFVVDHDPGPLAALQGHAPLGFLGPPGVRLFAFRGRCPGVERILTLTLDQEHSRPADPDCRRASSRSPSLFLTA